MTEGARTMAGGVPFMADRVTRRCGIMREIASLPPYQCAHPATAEITFGCAHQHVSTIAACEACHDEVMTYLAMAAVACTRCLGLSCGCRVVCIRSAAVEHSMVLAW